MGKRCKRKIKWRRLSLNEVDNQEQEDEDVDGDVLSARTAHSFSCDGGSGLTHSQDSRFRWGKPNKHISKNVKGTFKPGKLPSKGFFKGQGQRSWSYEDSICLSPGDDGSQDGKSVHTVLINNEEYTKIRTPRQEVIFKKSYLDRKRGSTECVSDAVDEEEELEDFEDDSSERMRSSSDGYEGSIQDGLPLGYQYDATGIIYPPEAKPPLAGVVMQQAYPGGPMFTIPVQWTPFLDPGLIPGDTALTPLDPSFTHVIDPSVMPIDPTQILVHHDASGCPITVQVRVDEMGTPIQVEPSVITVSTNLCPSSLPLIPQEGEDAHAAIENASFQEDKSSLDHDDGHRAEAASDSSDSLYASMSEASSAPTTPAGDLPDPAHAALAAKVLDQGLQEKNEEEALREDEHKNMISEDPSEETEVDPDGVESCDTSQAACNENVKVSCREQEGDEMNSSEKVDEENVNMDENEEPEIREERPNEVEHSVSETVEVVEAESLETELSGSEIKEESQEEEKLGKEEKDLDENSSGCADLEQQMEEVDFLLVNGESGSEEVIKENEDEKPETNGDYDENAVDSGNCEDSDGITVVKPGYVMVPILTPYYHPSVLYGYPVGSPVQVSPEPTAERASKKKKKKNWKKQHEKQNSVHGVQYISLPLQPADLITPIAGVSLSEAYTEEMHQQTVEANTVFSDLQEKEKEEIKVILHEEEEKNKKSTLLESNDSGLSESEEPSNDTAFSKHHFQDQMFPETEHEPLKEIPPSDSSTYNSSVCEEKIESAHNGKSRPEESEIVELHSHNENIEENSALSTESPVPVTAVVAEMSEVLEKKGGGKRRSKSKSSRKNKKSKQKMESSKNTTVDNHNLMTGVNSKDTLKKTIIHKPKESTVIEDPGEVNIEDSSEVNKDEIDVDVNLRSEVKLVEETFFQVEENGVLDIAEPDDSSSKKLQVDDYIKDSFRKEVVNSCKGNDMAESLIEEFISTTQTLIEENVQKAESKNEIQSEITVQEIKSEMKNDVSEYFENSAVYVIQSPMSLTEAVKTWIREVTPEKAFNLSEETQRLIMSYQAEGCEEEFYFDDEIDKKSEIDSKNVMGNPFAAGSSELLCCILDACGKGVANQDLVTIDDCDKDSSSISIFSRDRLYSECSSAAVCSIFESDDDDNEQHLAHQHCNPTVYLKYYQLCHVEANSVSPVQSASQSKKSTPGRDVSELSSEDVDVLSRKFSQPPSFSPKVSLTEEILAAESAENLLKHHSMQNEKCHHIKKLRNCVFNNDDCCGIAEPRSSVSSSGIGSSLVSSPEGSPVHISSGDSQLLPIATKDSTDFARGPTPCRTVCCTLI